MAILTHELWEEELGWTFCLAGPMGNGARSVLSQGAKLVWTVNAGSHFEAMTKYYEHQGWGCYSTDHPIDRDPYPDEWAKIQQQIKER